MRTVLKVAMAAVAMMIGAGVASAAEKPLKQHHHAQTMHKSSKHHASKATHKRNASKHSNKHYASKHAHKHVASKRTHKHAA